MKSAFGPTAAPFLVVITFVSLFHSTVYGEVVDAKRCPTEEEFLNPGSYWTNCPLIQTNPESPPGHASVSDYVFPYLIRFDQVGAGRNKIEIRWSGPNYFHEDEFLAGPLIPGNPESATVFWGPCQFWHGEDNCDYYPPYCGTDCFISYAFAHFDTPSRELLAENVGTWSFTVLGDDVELTPYSRTFEVHELEITAVSGNNQIGIVDQNLADPLVLKLHTFDDKPVKDEVVDLHPRLTH